MHNQRLKKNLPSLVTLKHKDCFLSNQRVEDAAREDAKALTFFRGVAAGVEGVTIVTMSEVT